MAETPVPESKEAPRDSDPASDSTLQGYLSRHNRPPAFQGSDSHPYTVSPEVEKTPNLRAPFSGYLVFPRWAESGLGIVGHLETPILVEESTRRRAEEALGSLTLFQLRDLLEEAIQRDLHGTNDA